MLYINFCLFKEICMASKGMRKHNPTVSKKHLSVHAGNYIFFFPWNKRAVLGVVDLFALLLPLLGVHAGSSSFFFWTELFWCSCLAFALLYTLLHRGNFWYTTVIKADLLFPGHWSKGQRSPADWGTCSRATPTTSHRGTWISSGKLTAPVITTTAYWLCATIVSEFQP